MEKETKKVKKGVILSLETNYGSICKEILKVLAERQSNSQAMMEGAQGISPLVRFLILRIEMTLKPYAGHFPK